MSKVRLCKKGCGYPAIKGRQFCQWHALMRASSDEQAAAANRRLLATAEEDRVARVSKKDWPLGERWCAGCQSFVPVFYVSGSRCKACASSAAHSRRLEAEYGITPEEYQRILKLQGGRCAICRNKPRTIRFATDHDHKTGAVRGILCKRCNHDLLGGGHDSIDLLFRAIEYLLYPPAQRDCPPLRAAVLRALEEYLTLQDMRDGKTLPEQQPPPF